MQHLTQRYSNHVSGTNVRRSERRRREAEWSAHRRPARGRRAQAAAAERLNARQLTLAVALILILAIAAWVAGAHENATLRVKSITVQGGDTLWTLAQTNRVSGASVPQTVYVIARLNHLESDTLQPGQHLKVPSQLPVRSSQTLAMR